MENKRSDLLAALLQRTQAKQIRWQELSDDSYRADVGAGMVRIEREAEYWKDDEGIPWDKTELHVSVIGPSGSLADYFTRKYGSTENQLFEAARHSATNATEIYDDMLHALNGS